MAASLVSLAFIQFPHPGREHNPGNAKRQPWNRCQHRRKFILSDGCSLDGDGSTHDAPLVFWAEWEAPSYIVDQWHEDGALPRFLHKPVWEHPADTVSRQNTDPWVFGICFRYSNCKQHSQYGLRMLASGSLILFGSTLNKKFVVDTVFVVRDAQQLILKQPPDIDEAFRVCTVESLLTDADCSGEEFILYRGATYGDPINGMYSFVPCRRADSAERRFARPPILLPADYINPKSTQTPSGATKGRSVRDLQECWQSVRQQVLDAGCLLGVSFSTPPLDDTRSGES